MIFALLARNGLATLFHYQSAMLENKARDILADDCVFYISAPLEKLTGITSILANFIIPLRNAFTFGVTAVTFYLLVGKIPVLKAEIGWRA